MGDAHRVLQDGQEARLVDRVVPVGAVDAKTRVPDGAQRAHAHALEPAVLLQHAKCLQDQAWIALEHLRITQVQQFVHGIEMTVQRARRAGVLAQQADLQ